MSASRSESVALARRLYAEGLPVARILAETGLSVGALYVGLDGGAAGGSPPLARRRYSRPPAAGPQADRRAVRLWQRAERQVRAIQSRLAILTQTLGDLAGAVAAAPPPAAPGDDDAPRDIAAFARALAAHLDGLPERRH